MDLISQMDYQDRGQYPPQDRTQDLFDAKK